MRSTGKPMQNKRKGDPLQKTNIIKEKGGF